MRAVTPLSTFDVRSAHRASALLACRASVVLIAAVVTLLFVAESPALVALAMAVGAACGWCRWLEDQPSSGFPEEPFGRVSGETSYAAIKEVRR